MCLLLFLYSSNIWHAHIYVIINILCYFWIKLNNKIHNFPTSHKYNKVEGWDEELIRARYKVEGGATICL